MMRASAYVVLSIGIAACGGSETGSAPAGQALFEANCAMCHGAGATGDGPMATSLPVRPPNILEHLGHHTEGQLIRLVQAGIPPAMPPSALSAEEIGLVIAYAWTLLPEAQQAALRATQDSVAAGLLAPGMPATPATPMDHPGN